MDAFDKKREMVQLLMSLLKKNASDEVSGAMAKPMADGGMSEASDQPEREMPSDLPAEDVSNPALANLPGPVEDEGMEKDDLQAEHDADIMDEDEDNNSSAFEAFLPRKRKK